MTIEYVIESSQFLPKRPMIFNATNFFKTKGGAGMFPVAELKKTSDMSISVKLDYNLEGLSRGEISGWDRHGFSDGLARNLSRDGEGIIVWRKIGDFMTDGNKIAQAVLFQSQAGGQEWEMGMAFEISILEVLRKNGSADIDFKKLIGSRDVTGDLQDDDFKKSLLFMRRYR